MNAAAGDNRMSKDAPSILYPRSKIRITSENARRAGRFASAGSAYFVAVAFAGTCACVAAAETERIDAMTGTPFR